jgi:two-component system chemotaxis response regulator CheY
VDYGGRKMKGKILIVDDAAFMRMMIKDTLKNHGYENIIEAADGEIAVQTYKTEKPDLVIMDITMPNKNGLEALKEIRELDPNAVIVMCSAMGQESMVVEAIRNGAKDFIVKPFKADRILKTVQGIMS